MLADSLIHQTVTRFPRFAKRAIEIEPVEKGGSDRRYYRVRVTDEHSLILVKYGDGKEENRHYVSIARFLAGIGVAVPEIYFHDETEGLIWMEDLGERDLWSHRNDPWETRHTLYQGALQELAKLHTRAHCDAGRAGLTLQPEFSETLYQWEQGYFIENCLGRWFGVVAEIDPAPLRRIASILAARPAVLVHRDFQSQNIMIQEERDGRAFLIDFQGLRPGLGEYDLASLVYDPYVVLTPEERAELIRDYISLRADAGAPVTEDFEMTLGYCALQRLMQALGAYGFLGLVKERSAFLQHIPPALASLRGVVAAIPELDEWRDLLAQLPSRTP